MNTCFPVLFLCFPAFWESGILACASQCLHNQFPINSLESESLITYILLHFHCRGEECVLYGSSKKGESIKKPCTRIPPDPAYVYFTVIQLHVLIVPLQLAMNHKYIYWVLWVFIAILQIGGVGLRDPWHRKPENFSSQQFTYSLTILPDEVPGPSESKSTISAS